ncbi:hypothetical protein, partial [Helicobacter sp. 23-1045]
CREVRKRHLDAKSAIKLNAFKIRLRIQQIVANLFLPTFLLHFLPQNPKPYKSKCPFKNIKSFCL